ncbi:SDR family NAD(P)-dependent oxidoreductase [Methylovirgula sp. 4M-Z18]|uniref:SDR family NAD(P)-dependent oxidoreductase n=1 Tax=Methylovirgula sp. 4M-Z18 TaxID=2293567 RepID=UPI000E2FC722|nr:SDR family oxidoreductase [Methylovirgula sp. 4M-Z18]RFB79402.1 SDR family oxidoreductase [Methylovirgula sp. 4M-Z18]
MQRLKNKVAIVTGAAGGIGLACAQRFAADGAKVVISDINTAQGKAAAEALTQTGAEAIFVETDVTQRESIDDLIAQSVKAFGQVDIMLNNAGIAVSVPFLETSDELFDKVMATNLKSAFMGGQAAAKQMVKQGHGGVIINMSSVNALLAIQGMVGYACSKGAMNQLTRVMAIELAPRNIRVCAIGPGTIMTELAKNAVMGNDEARRKILSRTPIGRAGEPSEIASVASFLASDDASYMTGQIVYPDGGRMALNYTVPVAD